MTGSYNTLAIPLYLCTALRAEMRKCAKAARGDEWEKRRVRLEVSNLREQFSKMVCCNTAAGLTPSGYPVSVAERALWPLMDARERSGDLRAADYLEAKQHALEVSERVVSHLAQSQALAFPFRAEVFEAGLWFHRSGHWASSWNTARTFAAACELFATGTIWLPPYEPDWIDSGTAGADLDKAIAANIAAIGFALPTVGSGVAEKKGGR